MFELKTCAIRPSKGIKGKLLLCWFHPAAASWGNHKSDLVNIYLLSQVQSAAKIGNESKEQDIYVIWKYLKKCRYDLQLIWFCLMKLLFGCHGSFVFIFSPVVRWSRIKNLKYVLGTGTVRNLLFVCKLPTYW